MDKIHARNMPAICLGPRLCHLPGFCGHLSWRLCCGLQRRKMDGLEPVFPLSTAGRRRLSRQGLVLRIQDRAQRPNPWPQTVSLRPTSMQALPTSVECVGVGGPLASCSESAQRWWPTQQRPSHGCITRASVFPSVKWGCFGGQVIVRASHACKTQKTVWHIMAWFYCYYEQGLGSFNPWW